MAESVYKVIELVGTSEESWEKAAKAAVERAAPEPRYVAQAVTWLRQERWNERLYRVLR